MLVYPTRYYQRDLHTLTVMFNEGRTSGSYLSDMERVWLLITSQRNFNPLKINKREI